MLNTCLSLTISPLCLRIIPHISACLPTCLWTLLRLQPSHAIHPFSSAFASHLTSSLHLIPTINHPNLTSSVCVLALGPPYNIVNHCVSYLHFLYFTGKPFNAQSLINSAVSNIICCLVFGDRFEYTDKQYQCILQNFNELVYLEGGVWAQVSPIYKQQ